MTFYLLLVLGACAPDYPSDDDHIDATAAACASCHVDAEDADAPPPSDNHFDDDGALEDDRVECSSCHTIAD